MTIHVNGEEIPDEAIQYELSRLVGFYSQHMPPEQVREQIGALREKAKEQAVGAKLLIDEATRLDIRVTEDDIDAKIAEMKTSCGGEEGFNKFMTERKLSVEKLREGIERGRKVDKLVEKIGSEAQEPTGDEIRAYFSTHEAEFVKPERTQAQHILVTPDSDADADKVKARGTIAELRQRVSDGEDFAEVAAAHSACPSGQRAGGSLGWFSRGMMVKEFDDAVFAMEVDELSEIIETQFGYHIIKKTGQEGSAPASFAESTDQIRDLLRHAKRGEVITAYVNDLREKAIIEED